MMQTYDRLRPSYLAFGGDDAGKGRLTEQLGEEGRIAAARDGEGEMSPTSCVRHG